MCGGAGVFDDNWSLASALVVVVVVVGLGVGVLGAVGVGVGKVAGRMAVSTGRCKGGTPHRCKYVQVWWRRLAADP